MITVVVFMLNVFFFILKIVVLSKKINGASSILFEIFLCQCIYFGLMFLHK